jgi:spore maturation protein CgeB
MQTRRLHITPRLRGIMTYDKFAGETPRLMILRGEYWLDSACERAAGQLGWRVLSVPVVMEGALTKQHLAQLFESLVTFRPDFILSINLSGMDLQGLLAGLFRDLAVPHVTWFVDDPRTIIMDRTCFATDCSIALTWDAAYIPYLRLSGFPQVYHVPLAVDTTLFNNAPAESWRQSPAFVGNSMEIPAQRAWECINGQSEIAAAIHRAFDAGLVTRLNFGAGVDSILDEKVWRSLDAEGRRHAEMILFTEGTRRIRRHFLEPLVEDGVAVRGDEGWSRWHPNVGPPLSYGQELASFYRDCEVNLNLTNIQMPGAANQRVFDCPAAGGFLLTDAQSEVISLFDPNRECATFSSPEECRDKLRWFRAHPAARNTIVRHAQQRILAEHTYPHRLQQILNIILRTIP